MVKILYSVNGDGLGHASRSVPVIQALAKKHQIKIIISSKTSGEFLKRYFPSVQIYDGIRFIYRKNSVNVYKTITESSKQLLSRSSTFRAIYKTIKDYKPDIIVVDCDFPTISVARLFDIPIICVCNIHAMTEMRFDVPKEYKRLYYTQKILIKAISSSVDYHVITNFFSLPVKNNNVFVYPPVLRKEIFAAKPSRKNYYLVYQTSATNDALVRVLKSVDERFIVYGFHKDEVDGNITFKKNNVKEFFNDFKDCRACIANGGHSFISEALALHKPILSIPIKGTFEQILNGLEIKKLGYGEMCHKITRPILKKFIKNNDRYYEAVKKYHNPGNKAVIDKIEELISTGMK